MSDFPAADHAMGLELQIEEAHEQLERAVVQGRTDDAARLTAEIESLQAELAATAERLVEEPVAPSVAPELHDAEQLNLDAEPD